MAAEAQSMNFTTVVSAPGPVPHLPGGGLSLQPEDQRLAQPATHWQKLVFTIMTANNALHEIPNCKMLVVLENNIVVTEYARQLEQRCTAAVQQMLDHPLRRRQSQPQVDSPHIVIATITALAKAISTDQIHLERFHVLLLDHSFLEDEMYSNVLLIALQWGLLPDNKRPLYIDLFSMGKRSPPSIEPATSLQEKTVPGNSSTPAGTTEDVHNAGELAANYDMLKAPREAFATVSHFLEHLKSMDWNSGLTMVIFVQEEAFSAPLVRMINEDLGDTMATQIASRSALDEDEEGQIFVLPSHVKVDISKCDMVATVDKQGFLQLVPNMKTKDHPGPDDDVDEDLFTPDVQPENRMVYPYQHDSGHQVNIGNCFGIFLSYCRAVLQEHVNENQFFQYNWDRRHRIDVLCSVMYPSPQGRVRITNKHVHAAWAGRTVIDTISPKQCERMRRSSVQKRWFVYVAVMDMIQNGYLDVCNNPTALAMSDTTRHLWSSDSCVKAAGNTLTQVPQAPSSAGLAPMLECTHYHRQPPGQHVKAWLPNKDPKSQLNELQHKIQNLLLLYETVSTSKNSQQACFQSTVVLQYGNQTVKLVGDMCNSKKNAEKNAALAALQYINGGGVSNSLRGAAHLTTA